VTITYHPEALPLQRQAATQSLTSQSSS
jgi:hypothetical protein